MKFILKIKIPILLKTPMIVLVSLVEREETENTLETKIHFYLSFLERNNISKIFSLIMAVKLDFPMC